MRDNPESDWTPVTTLPPAGRPVLAHVVGLRNDGSGVVLRASYWPAKTLECADDYEEWGETDPDTGELWSPAGWYESREVDCPTCGEGCLAHIGTATVTHWMSLPAKPEKES